MKLNTVMPYKHVAQRQAFTITQDPVTFEVVRSYYPAGSIALTFVSQSRRTPTVYTDVDLELFDLVDQIVDLSGESIDDQVWVVNYKMPVLNAFGYVDGYVYTLTLFAEANV